MCVCILFYDWRVKNGHLWVCDCVLVCELCKNILKLRRRRLQQMGTPFAHHPSCSCSIVVFWFRSLFWPPLPVSLLPSLSLLSHFICHSCMHTCAEHSPSHPFAHSGTWRLSFFVFATHLAVFVLRLLLLLFLFVHGWVSFPFFLILLKIYDLFLFYFVFVLIEN